MSVMTMMTMVTNCAMKIMLMMMIMTMTMMMTIMTKFKLPSAAGAVISWPPFKAAKAESQPSFTCYPQDDKDDSVLMVVLMASHGLSFGEA